MLKDARTTNINTATDTVTRCYYYSLLQVILVGVVAGETNKYYGGRKLAQKRTRPEKHA